MNDNSLVAAVGVLFAAMLFLWIYYQGFGIKDVVRIVYYPDGSWIKGLRKHNYRSQETHGTYQFMVLDSSENLKTLVGRRISVPINSAKYFVFEEYNNARKT